MSLYNQYTLCTLVLGVVMPLLVAVVLKESWRKEVKTGVAVATCTLAALVLCFLQGKLDGNDLVGTVIAVNGLSMLLFQNFWKPLGVANPLESLTSSLLFFKNLSKSPSAPVASSPKSTPSTDE